MTYRDERGRPSAAKRGYDRNHRHLRESWTPLVATGGVTCWRCGQLIEKGEAWDLGHDDHDRTRYQGPEHAGRCNRAAPHRKARPDPPASGAAWW